MSAHVPEIARPIPERIVAEVSKNWPEQQECPLLSERFELVIRTNAERGYELESWRLSRVVQPKGDLFDECLNETIVAVFVRRGP